MRLNLDMPLSPAWYLHVQSSAMRRFARALAVLALPVAALSACAQGPVADRSAGHRAGPLADGLPGHAVVLLGEVHDNPDGHRLRTRAMAQAMRAGWRPIIAMEQFDRERQQDLDEAMQSCNDAGCVIEQASPGPSGWNWDYYKPVIALALQYRLPLVAANLSRQDARRVMTEGLAAVFPPDALRDMGLQDGPPAGLLKRQIQEVVQGHCGMLPASMHQGMATAQIARDAMMAWLMRRAIAPVSPAREGLLRGTHAAQSRPLVLLAGNGHVRKDQGVPRWLGLNDILTVGFTEGPAPQSEYDHNIVVPPVQRPDPCEALYSAPVKPRRLGP